MKAEPDQPSPRSPGGSASERADEEFVRAVSAKGYTLIERDLGEGTHVWAWIGEGLSPGWWPSRTRAIDHLRDYLSDTA
jgi:hypothetical protein